MKKFLTKWTVPIVKMNFECYNDLRKEEFMSPRIQRSDSSMDLYNVMILSNNNEVIFRDEVDYKFMTELIVGSGSGCEVYSYCILPDRANFLISPGEESLSSIMKKINMTYAIYYNKRYFRSGHVFHDRYRSRSVEEDEILSVMRSIHHMPVLEGYSEKMAEYDFSSYKYFQSLRGKADMVNIKGKLIKLDDILSEEVGRGYECIGKYFSDPGKIARMLIEEFYDKYNINGVVLKDKSCESYRRELVVLIRTNTNFSIRKISELLDINRGEVYKFISLIEEEEK
ncbi:MAG: transposase [Eubacteriaceae bacterium]|nr:transposase [Eubacteriaceae bacterium]